MWLIGEAGYFSGVTHISGHNARLTDGGQSATKLHSSTSGSLVGAPGPWRRFWYVRLAHREDMETPFQQSYVVR